MAAVRQRDPYGEMHHPEVIPIPLRPDFTARVHIPLDLTEAEARKIGAVVLAYAVKPQREG